MAPAALRRNLHTLTPSVRSDVRWRRCRRPNRRAADGTRIATLIGVRYLIAATVGILIGQWLAFSAVPSPANLYNLGMAPAERPDEAETRRSRGRPAPPPPH